MNNKALCVSLFAALVVSLSGCTKKDDSGTAASSPMSTLDKAPAAAIAFNYVDTSVKGYADFKKSPFFQVLGQFGSTLQQLASQSPGGELKEAQAIFKALEENSLSITSQPVEPGQSPVREITSFIVPPDASGKIAYGYYVQGASGADLVKKLEGFTKSLVTSGLTPAKLAITGAIDGYSLQLKSLEAAGGALPLPSTVFMAASQEIFAAASSKELVEKAFQIPTAGTGFLVSEQFNKAKPFLPTNLAEAISISYLNFKPLLDTGMAMMPPEERAKAQAQLGEMPVDRLVGYMRMDQSGPTWTYSVPFEAKNELQTKVLAGLKSASSLGSSLSAAPADSILHIGFDGGALRSVVAVIVSQLSPEQIQAAGMAVGYLKKLKAIGLGVMNAPNPTAFPQAFVAVDSNEAESLQQELKSFADMGAMASGMPSEGWQQKKIEGVDFDIMASPIGPGLYLGRSNATLIAASGEEASQSIAKASAGGPSLKNSFGSSANGFLSVYFNFAKLPDLWKNIQSSLGMFMGDALPVDAAKLEQLKGLGSLSAAVRSLDNALQIEARFQTVN